MTWLAVLVLSAVALIGSDWGGGCGGGYDEEPEPGIAPPPVPVAASVRPLIVLDGEPTVSIGNVTFNVEVAHIPELRVRGLSGREGIADDSGMLFVFDSGRTTEFWMRGMSFPLDFVWIGDDCTVVDLHKYVREPLPGTVDADLEHYASRVPAKYNLEIAAGTVTQRGISVGDRVRFSGIDGEGAGC